MPNTALVNFVAGETSPRSRGRFDLPWFGASCQKLLNFICEVSGPARYRSGFRHVAETSAGAVARLVPFVLDSSRKYMLEFTPGKMRVYSDEALVVIERTTVTALTNASPAVVSVASTTNLSNGDVVILTGLVGMLELNGRQVKLANKVGSTYQLLDPVTDVAINSTGFGVYTSGGTVSEVYEIDTPYLTETSLDNLQWAADGNAATMYLTSVGIAPYKLVVAGSDSSFTLATYVRTADPFNAAADNLTGFINVNNGTTTRLVFTGGTTNESVIYEFSTFVGVVQLNGGRYRLVIDHTPSPYNIAWLKNLDGTDVDSSAWGVYVSGGLGTPDPETPIGVAFYESRLMFVGTDQRPNVILGSRAPSDTGSTRYDDFTGGTSADHAVAFALAPASGQVDYLTWGRGTSRYFFAGSFGGPFRLSGSGVDEPITPDSINSKQVDLFGCESVMAAGGARIYFIQRGGTAIRALRYNVDLEEYESQDIMLNAEQMAESPLRRVVLQTGRPDLLWSVRDDGFLVGVTIQGNENVTGWHRHKAGGDDAKFLDAQPFPRSDKNDQLWAVTERTIDGVTRRSVEIQADDVPFPDREDFYGHGADEAADRTLWENAIYRRQEEYIHLDAAGTYNGSDRGVAAGATLTLSSLAVGTGRTATASAAVFAATDVGREIWVKPDRDTGVGGGRALITAFTSTTQVTVTVTVAFSSVGAHAAGDWYFTATTIYGLWYLEGQSVAVLTDGAVYSDGRGDVGTAVTVSSGKITLTEAAAVVHIGPPYGGILKTQNLETGSQTGPAQAKPRNIFEFALRFLNTLGVQYGTDLYNLETIDHRRNNAVADRPAPVFSGIRKLPYPDRWRGTDNEPEEKHIVIAQVLPLPATIQFIDVRYEVGDE